MTCQDNPHFLPSTFSARINGRTGRSSVLSSAPELTDITGQYFESSTHPKDLRAEVIDYAKQEQAWELGTELVRDAPTAILTKEHSLLDSIVVEAN